MACVKRGALIAYLDSDNLWHPDYLATAVALLQAQPGRSALYMEYLDCRLQPSGKVALERYTGRAFDPESRLGKALTDALIGLPYSVSTDEALALRELRHNAPLAAVLQQERAATRRLEQYHPHSKIGLLGDGNMANTSEDMQREAHEWLKASIRKLDPDEVLQCYAPEERDRTGMLSPWPCP